MSPLARETAARAPYATISRAIWRKWPATGTGLRSGIDGLIRGGSWRLARVGLFEGALGPSRFRDGPRRLQCATPMSLLHRIAVRRVESGTACIKDELRL